jgi:hypothetical protein
MWWTAPAPSNELPYGGRCSESHQGAFDMQITTIGLDIAKNVFQVHCIDAAEKVVVMDSSFNILIYRQHRRCLQIFQKPLEIYTVRLNIVAP